MRERLLAYNTAALSGIAYVGKLRTFEEHFPNGDAVQTSGSAVLLSALFKMKRKGVSMTIERIDRAA